VNLRTTLVLLLLVAGLGAYVLWVDRRTESTREREAQARQALRVVPARVTSFTLAGDRFEATGVQTNGHWGLTRPLAARADAAAVDRFLSALERLPRGEVITPAQRRARHLTLADYGLAPPRLRVTLQAGARRQTVLFGRLAPLGGALYVMDPARDEVIATDAAVTNDLPAGVAALRDHALFTGPAAAVQRLDLRGSGRLLQLVRTEPGDWQIQQPVVARADRAVVQDVLEKLFAWKAVDFVSDNVADLAPYGLDENALRVSLNAGGKSGEQTLLLGKPAGTNAGLIYAATPPEKTVLTVGSAPLAELQLKLDDLRDRRLFTLPVHDVGGVRLQQGERTLELRQGPDGAWALRQPRQAPADAQRVQDFLHQVTGARIETFLDQAATNLAALGLTTPEWKLTLLRAPAGAAVTGAPPAAGAAGTDQQVLLVSAQPRPGGRRVVKLEHEAAPYEVAGAALAGLTVDPLAFRSREVLHLPAGDILRLTRVCRGATQTVERASATNDFLAVAPAPAAVQRAVLAQLVQTVSRLTAVRLVAEDARDLQRYGLATPALSLTLGLKGETGLVKTLLLGAPAPGGVFALWRGQDLVFVLDPAVGALLGRDWFQPAAPAPPAQKEAPDAAVTNRAARRP